MNINNKGFTLVEVMAVVAIISILSGMAVMSVTKYVARTRTKVYNNYESNMKTAAEAYLMRNTELIPTSGETQVTTVVLQEENLLEKLTDPVDSTKDCSGYIIIKNKGNLKSNADTITSGDYTTSNTTNIDLNYQACLTCSTYKTPEC